MLFLRNLEGSDTLCVLRIMFERAHQMNPHFISVNVSLIQ